MAKFSMPWKRTLTVSRADLCWPNLLLGKEKIVKEYVTGMVLQTYRRTSCRVDKTHVCTY